MNDAVFSKEAEAETFDFDVLFVGAGISGIGCAHHLREQCPGKSFVILDSKDGHGGTWRQHTYPGIRSDSDLYTFGYRFRAWGGKPIAPAGDILEYLSGVIEDDGLDQRIRYRRKVTKAAWSSEAKRWMVDVENLETGATERYTAGFLWMCQGYYQHEEGYTPDWPGMADYKGRIVHPQTWPDDLDYKGKRVVVIGSGATAATIIPSMAEDVEHITMLQRSPTYFHPGINQNELADRLRSLDVPEMWVHEIIRRAYLKDAQEVQNFALTCPGEAKQELLGVVREHLGPDFDVETHFNPSYNPWRQRLAFVPDGDLFEAIKAGKASIATDHIERFTETGIQLKSGQHLDADLIITATGFNLSAFGDIPFEVDGEQIDFGKTITYRGVMLADIPNMAHVFGYLRSSWTLRVDLVGDFVCRVMNEMASKQAAVVTPRLRPEDRDMALDNWIPETEFNPGYMLRRIHLLPKRGDKDPWRFSTDYYVERETLPKADLEDGALVFS